LGQNPQTFMIPTLKWRKGDYALFSVLSNILQNILSKKIVC